MVAFLLASGLFLRIRNLGFSRSTGRFEGCGRRAERERRGFSACKLWRRQRCSASVTFLDSAFACAGTSFSTATLSGNLQGEEAGFAIAGPFTPSGVFGCLELWRAESWQKQRRSCGSSLRRAMLAYFDRRRWRLRTRSGQPWFSPCCSYLAVGRSSFIFFVRRVRFSTFKRIASFRM